MQLHFTALVWLAQPTDQFRGNIQSAETLMGTYIGTWLAHVK